LPPNLGSMAVSEPSAVRAHRSRVPIARFASVWLFAFALTLFACGSAHIVQDSDARFDVPAAASTEVPSHLAVTARAAQRVYNRETRGSKLRGEADRIASDRILLSALARGDVAAAQAEADAQLLSAANHFAHVTRIGVVRGGRVLVNATLNSDGTFVVAPARRDLRLHGRRLGTLLVSIQDVTGFVKLVHRRTGAEVVVRGAGAQVRASLAAATHLRLPAAGHVRIAGRRYTVRSFHELGWGREALTVWILEHA
jgi:hypothetical protein